MRQADEEGLAVAQSAVTLLLTPPTKVTEARIEQRQITDWSPVA
jgi:hypothetical protein